MTKTPTAAETADKAMDLIGQISAKAEAECRKSLAVEIDRYARMTYASDIESMREYLGEDFTPTEEFLRALRFAARLVGDLNFEH